ncbi:MAG: FAD-binding oxidoreductase [Desulfovibrio sp.]|jgi:FAD/FMN-containing dehydrogenase/Fe-S oxidoreductase|nr:FAD-binding oxidoreductase [Desulfovibrio sp.]
MLSKGPHISIEAPSLVPRILRIGAEEFATWPEGVRHLTMDLAAELFLVRYNPFIDAETVKKSVQENFESSRRALAQHYAASIGEGLTMFWSAHESDMAFRRELIFRLRVFLPAECMDAAPHALVENSTDATDLRLELPLLVVSPRNVAQVREVVKLAAEMQFALVPRGSGSGLTGGAIPALKRSVVLSLTGLNAIGPIDEAGQSLWLEAGAVTADAYRAAARHGLLFSVDPASREASSIGGNIAENAGGPMCFEYGTTIDNLLSYRMVTPGGALIEVRRLNHPRHKILPDETALFEVSDGEGGLIRRIALRGDAIRTPGLGKDVTDKALGGLPGVQKEGTDGVIVDASFILHKYPAHYRVLVLEFFGRSMENCMLVVNDVVALRNDIRGRGDLVKITALEEFGLKYVQAIGYQKKSLIYEGDPISVLILQMDSDDEKALGEAARAIVQISDSYDGVDVFVAEDARQAEEFWEDRHRLSAIARRTSGFKINEDVVLPLKAIPDFALYLESLNLEYMARAYRAALHQCSLLPGFPEEEERVRAELDNVGRIIKGEIPSLDISDQELQMRARLFFRAFVADYPRYAAEMEKIQDYFLASAISAASHMHAGDGNWHVNIPVNSNDPDMLANAETAARQVMAKAQELGGEVTGEHGIGVTKIAFLRKEKMEAFRNYKEAVDPGSIFNPAKLTRRELPVSSFTFSFNRLIQDIRQSGLADKERLISLLSNVQFCTRCGKCRRPCPMHYPERGLLFHPRNKNMSLGALIEAVYYSQVNHGRPDPALLSALRNIMEHCTGCGQCTAVCPVKIASAEVSLASRGYLEEEGAGGHPLKSWALKAIALNPERRIPLAGKAASVGQAVQNRILALAPAPIKARMSSPLFSGPGPRPGYRNLAERLHLERGSIFAPEGVLRGSVLYFPGCGAGVFYPRIAVAAIGLLLSSGYAVILPEAQICCGYPLLAAGLGRLFESNVKPNRAKLSERTRKAAVFGMECGAVLSSCGSCRDALERCLLAEPLSGEGNVPPPLDDVANFLFSRVLERRNVREQGGVQADGKGAGGEVAGLGSSGGGESALLSPDGVLGRVIYHAPCHAEVSGVNKSRAARLYARNLGRCLGARVRLSPGCCAEAGLGAVTAPYIYNKIRERKQAQLRADMAALPADSPLLVSCPSCKMGLSRILLNMGGDFRKRRVRHCLEYMAERTGGDKILRRTAKLLRSSRARDGVRVVNMADLATVGLNETDAIDDDFDVLDED